MRQSIGGFNILTPPGQPTAIDCRSFSGVGNLPGWGGEFEPELSSLSGKVNVFYHMEVFISKKIHFHGKIT